MLSIQLINSKKLNADENLWLRFLSNKLKPQNALQVINMAGKRDKDDRIFAYINAITQANFNAIEEAIQMNKPAKSLREVLIRTGLAAEWEAQGEARGEARGEERKAFNIAKNLVNLGLPFDAIVSSTGLEAEKVKTMYQN